jgi:hypothetical protein
MDKPRTIHDFYGFPQSFSTRYDAPGSKEIAGMTKKAITKTEVGLMRKWGLDHGDSRSSADVRRRIFLFCSSLDFNEEAGVSF